MNNKKIIVFLVLILTAVYGFGQAGVLRDYVGLISIRYHQDVVDYMGKFKESFEKKGYSNAAKSIDNYLKGLSGSGFIYVGPDGSSYILTNAHVVAQSDSLSITFEKLDGSKTIYEGLRVLYVDEEEDIAILGFESGKKPFTQALSFSTDPVDEGTDIFAAGFPGLGNTAIWQFSRGNVSNAAVRLPKSSDSDETIGPYIQHTAQIDPGNSGGPLLVASSDVLSGYAVVGINSLSARRRQAANYAIPVNKIQAFLDAALSQEPVNERGLIAKKVDDFLGGLKANKAVYDHIAKFLSNSGTASNAEYAISELLDKAPRTVLEDVDSTFINDPVSGMAAAVAWNIENSMRSKSGSLKIALDSITSNDMGGFYVDFNVNDAIVRSEWIKEYGVYRMDKYGESITGDKSLLADKEKKKEQDKALKTDFSATIGAGYAYVLDYGSALHASLQFMSPFYSGFDLYYGFGEKEYFQFGMNIGYAHAIRLGTFALIPYGDLGLAYVSSKASKATLPSKGLWYDDDLDTGFGFGVAFNLRAGMMFTSAKVPGLFGRLFYQHNLPFIKDKNNAIKGHGIIGIGIGYGFH